jgi:hypothetical protein
LHYLSSPIKKNILKDDILSLSIWQVCSCIL